MILALSGKIGDDSNQNLTVNTSVESDLVPTEIFFYLFLLVDIPAVLCSILLLYCFICLPELRQQHYTHQMIVYLLICAFLLDAFDIPLMLPYFHNHYFIASMHNRHSFCLFWILYDYVIYAVSLWFMALLSVERYLVIFFKNTALKNKAQRFFLYYVTVAMIVLFVLSWFTYAVALYPCTHTKFDYTSILCGFPCYETEASAAFLTFNWIVLGLLPTFLTVVFTSVLIVHVLYQRQKISRHWTQRETWKRTRKIFIQLLPITSIFLVFVMPATIVGLLAVSNPWYGTTPYLYTVYLAYGLPLTMPFAVLFNQKVVQRQLFALFKPRRLNQIAPLATRPAQMQQGDAGTILKAARRRELTAHLY